ncbi:hypothetical protein [Nocardioides sp. B-3]|uniref:hypothetical protein n=1 Tax=Nocardioides sp. B-3 TaxID=2895565 RepID=UPI002152BF18|nr:hypothetical protein [Nocardioides sp. B-3]UUZ59427.1 hypothetical protein LP418_27155 [Nocardioides sp. B-3]
MHLLLLGLVLRFVARLASQVAVSVGLLGEDRSTGTGDELLDLAPTWDRWWDWWPVLGLPVVCPVGVAVLTLLGWRATAAFDAPAEVAEAQNVHSGALKRMEMTARWRTVLVVGGLGWLLLACGLPAAVSGLTHLATENEPTTPGAATISAAGFATEERCASAFEADLAAAVEDADKLALLSPGTKQEVTAGACGGEVTLTRTADPATLTIVGADSETLSSVAGDDSLPGQVVGISALLALVAALLRVGPSPDAPAAASRWTRVRRVLLTRLPLLIVVLVATYPVLVWTYGFSGRDERHAPGLDGRPHRVRLHPGRPGRCQRDVLARLLPVSSQQRLRGGRRRRDTSRERSRRGARAGRGLPVLGVPAAGRLASGAAPGPAAACRRNPQLARRQRGAVDARWVPGRPQPVHGRGAP